MSEVYLGPLNILKMSAVQARAYRSWKDQQQRCGNPNNSRYYCYGALGIRRVYTSREFIGWYESAYRKVPPTWQRVQCGRIDHAGDYRLGNVQLEACSDNTRDRNARNGNPTYSKTLTAKNTQSGEIRVFESKRVAARELGVSRRAIRNQLSRKGKISRKLACGWEFSE